MLTEGECVVLVYIERKFVVFCGLTEADLRKCSFYPYLANQRYFAHFVDNLKARSYPPPTHSYKKKYTPEGVDETIQENETMKK